MINNKEIFETIQMINQQHLDVRTTTLGISLLDCIADTPKRTAEKVYDKITKSAKNLVKTANQLSSELGIPIVNKRVSVTPVSLITANNGGHLEVIRALDKAANEIGIDFLGGYSALVHKGMTEYEKQFIMSIPEALSTTGKVCSSVNVGSTKTGINMDAVALMGKIIRECAEKTADKDSLACAKLVVFCNAVEDNPFMAGAFHGVGENDLTLNVGVSGPGVVKHALESVGACGTTACLAMLNDAVKKGGIMASSAVGGLSGAFIPVSEDAGMIRATECGDLNIEKLEAMTCVCSVGLDMIAIPGDTPAEVISGIIADESAIGMVNMKTTAVRVIPVIGKGVGDYAEFGGLLGHAPIIAVNKNSPAKFIGRGGRIPAPLHSLKN